jgi:NADPH:quinone reductase-like Zn-dependent oxidoreductase
MKVAGFHDAGNVRVAEKEPPFPDCGESLVRVPAVGVCGSELSWFTEGGIGGTQILHPLMFGHEVAGVVQGGHLTGRQVAVVPARAYGVCEQCRGSKHNLHPFVRFACQGLPFKLPRRVNEMYTRATRLATDWLVDISAVVSATFALVSAGEAFRAAGDRLGLTDIVLPNT